MNLIKRSVLAFVFLVLTSLMVSLSIKAAVGVNASWDSVSQSVFYLSGIKVGTFGMILNLSCVLGQMILLNKDFPLSRLSQILVSLVSGFFVNIFYYDVLSLLTLDNYWIRLAVFIFAIVGMVFSVAVMLILDVFTFPLESLCLVVVEKTGWNFSVLRQSVDITSIIMSVLITVLFTHILVVREGTVIGMLLFGPLLGFFMTNLEPHFIKLKLTKVNV